ncbi:diadenylate cyclase CdaA [Petroclostridium sp. X23]|uniref:diadenylate cyclase CdaA n=1 Tax=Petroclostridium sp. X23 TaxID=3045146 RepID=UPI0024ACFFB5|nr:diadenylate cyclase CdaA [Petroclostridium sp. X23]WHH61181.1 diadenylate cyclase CdaA [Petroclostridium sp. X23]
MLQSLYDFLFQFIKFIKLSDIIDVTIVAYVIYKTIRLIRETRAEQLIKGIVILLVVTQLSDWLNLNTINFILKNTMQVGVLALLVVFQPELRRALEQMGRSRFGNMFVFEEYNTESSIALAIEEIAKAVHTLSQNRIGALMVIERDTKIGDIIRTGITMDSIISAELLVNIFIPNTPLHDGAVVIRENKIKAAACFLPLTQNQNLSKELGTRHRAALGISENSDAVVIVVSEETGKISFALDGDLTRNLTVETLKKALNKTIQISREKKNKKKLISWKGKGK